MKSFLPATWLFALPALAIHFAPNPVSAVLLYDRVAIAQGEWWRLTTGHWVHFGPAHLLGNLAILLFAAALLDHASIRLLPFTLLAAPALGLALYLLEPAMQVYGGLSGLACGVVTLLGLVRVAQNQPGGIWWLALLVAIAVKLALETGRTAPLLASFDHASVRASSWAHAAGALLAAGFFLSRLRPNSSPLARAGASAP